MIFGLITLLFYICSESFFKYFVDPDFSNAKNIVGVIATAQFLIGLWTMLLPATYFSGQTYWVPILQSIAALITVGSHLILIPSIGAQGAGIAVVLGCLSLVCLQLLLNYAKGFNVCLIEFQRMFLLILSLSFSICFVLALESSNGMNNYFTGAVSLIVYALSCISVFSEREKAMVGPFIRKLAAFLIEILGGISVRRQKT